MLTAGDAAPNFELESTDDGRTTLAGTLSRGPAVVLFNRGTWCSYCAEQLGTFSTLAYDLWRHLDLDVLPVLPAEAPALVEMRDRFDLRFQLLADPTLEVTRQWTDTEETGRRGEIPLASTFVVDAEGTVRYAQVAADPSDRTYANWVRHFVREGFEPPYA